MAGKQPANLRHASQRQRSWLSGGRWMLLIPLLMVSCSDAVGPTGDVAAVRFNLLTAPNLVVGQQIALQPIPMNGAGEDLNIVCIRTFSSDSPAVATVDQNGTVTAVSPGIANITATLNNVPKTIPVVVVTGGSLQVVPANASVGVGASTPFQASVRDAAGNVLVNPALTWTSSNTAIATINSGGVATGVAAGTVTIRATTADGRTGTATLTVSAATASTLTVTPPSSTIGVGATITLTATVRDAGGNVLPNRVVTWTSSNPSIATVTNDGTNQTQVRGVSSGTVTITATSEGRSATATVTVTSSGTGSIKVDPPSGGVSVGSTVQLNPTVRDAGGNPIAGAAVSFTSSDPSIASVSAGGLVTGVSPGAATISVSANGMTVTVPITVSAIPVATVEITPPNPTVCVGKSLQLSAILRDASGNLLTGRTVMFVSNNSLVAQVTAGGLLTGISAGTATITATSEGRSTTTTAPICLAASGSLTLSPAAASLGIGANTELVAVLRDDAGNVIAGRPVTFTSSNPSVATVDASGRVTGVAEGTTTITATSDGQTATSAITVVRTPVASIGLTPSSVNPCVGQWRQLTAVVRDASGNILTGRNVTFTSSAPAIATVDANGVVTGVVAGQATITATSEGQSTTAQATICVAATGSVTLTPATATVKVGATTKLTATVFDNLGNVLSGRPVTFTSSNLTVATVSADGTVVGLTPGTTTITATVDGKTSTSVVTVIP